MKRIVTVKELVFESKHDEKMVIRWLRLVLKQLMKNADGREGTVHRADFYNNDIFYFTDCSDILKDDPEPKSHEANRQIQTRKRYVMLQLLIKSLLGEVKLKKIGPCSHCGSDEQTIVWLRNGHAYFCKNCQYIRFGAYLSDCDVIAKEAKEKLSEMMKVKEGEKEV